MNYFPLFAKEVNVSNPKTNYRDISLGTEIGFWIGSGLLAKNYKALQTYQIDSVNPSKVDLSETEFVFLQENTDFFGGFLNSAVQATTYNQHGLAVTAFMQPGNQCYYIGTESQFATIKSTID
jgi:hypothetical protein